MLYVIILHGGSAVLLDSHLLGQSVWDICVLLAVLCVSVCLCVSVYARARAARACTPVTARAHSADS